MATSKEPASMAEQVLVERSQDSVQVTKNRMQRRSMTQPEDGSDDEETPQPDLEVGAREDSIAVNHRRLGHTESSKGGKRKKPKTRFFTDVVGLEEDSRKERKSISKRISNALGFKKLNLQEPAAVEQSPPSLHVKFQPQPKVID